MKSFTHIALFTLFCTLPLFSQPPAGMKPMPWSAGIFLISDSQPYVGAGRNVRVFPSVSYRGEKLQWNGPLIQYTFLKEPTWSFGAHSIIQFAPYEEDDAPILEGLGDRSDTVLAGLDASWSPFPQWTLIGSLDAEVFGAYDGLQGTLGLRRDLGKPWNMFSGRLGAGLLFQDQNWTRYFVGIPAEKATPERDPYTPSESFHPYLSAQLLVRLHPRWSWFTVTRIEFLDENWRDSPLIADDYRLVTFTTLNYSF